MARKYRIETNDGFYHIINRGNYRKHIFSDDGARQSFVKTLYEAVEKNQWELLSYVVMSNHYHLLIHTPYGNLARGMQWLQSTYANRFNRYHRSCGHLFQGRYKSLIIEPGEAIGSVADYIHLNPTRAGLVTVEKLRDYKWSSFAELWKKKRPGQLHIGGLLLKDLRLSDNHAGRRKYHERLCRKAGMTKGETQKWRKQCTRGWCIGSKAFKTELAKEYLGREGIVHCEGKELQEMNEEIWTSVLKLCLNAMKINPQDLEKMKKSAAEKVVIAAFLKKKTAASNQWITGNLRMGHSATMSGKVSAYRKNPTSGQCRLNKCLKRLKNAG